MSIYYTDKNTIDQKWVDKEAQEAAKSFFPSTNEAIKSSQLRKFYAEVKTLERRWQVSGADEDAFLRVVPSFKLLKAKSAYAKERKVVPENFRLWLWKHVDSVSNAQDFQAFLLHFEAVVGFSYEYAHVNNIENFN